MDRIALSNRLKGMSDIFVEGSPYKRELNAMAYVISNTPDEKFQAILNPGYDADKPASVESNEYVEARFPLMQDNRGPDSMGLRQQARKRLLSPSVSGRPGKIRDLAQFMLAAADKLSPTAISKIENIVKGEMESQPSAWNEQEVEEGITVGSPARAASEEVASDGGYWNVDASNAVLSNLLRDVTGMDKSICCDTGRKLTPEQTPDGKHKGTPKKPSTLTSEQTPDQEDVLESDIVKKSQGAVKKEAKEDKNEGSTEAQKKHEERAKAKAESLEEKAKQQAEQAAKDPDKSQEYAGEAAKSLEKAEKAEKSIEASGLPTTIEAEGIELTAPMEDVQMSDEEKSKLEQLFA